MNNIKNKKTKSLSLIFIVLLCTAIGLAVHYGLEKMLNMYISPLFPVLLILSLIVTMLIVMDYKYIRRYNKEGKRVHAKVLSCTSNTIRNKVGDKASDEHYIVRYLIEELDKETEVNIYAKREVGTIVEGVYVEEDDDFVTNNELKIVSDQKAFLVLNVCLYFLVGLVIFFSIIRDKVLIDWTVVFYIFMAVLLICTSIFSIYYFFATLLDRRKYEKIDATVIDCLEKNRKNRYTNSIIKIYYPVYEYTLDGKKQEYMDEITGIKRKNGYKTILLYDRNNKQIYLQKSVLYYLLAGILSIVFLVLVIMYGIF